MLNQGRILGFREVCGSGIVIEADPFWGSGG